MAAGIHDFSTSCLVEFTTSRLLKLKSKTPNYHQKKKHDCSRLSNLHWKGMSTLLSVNWRLGVSSVFCNVWMYFTTGVASPLVHSRSCTCTGPAGPPPCWRTAHANLHGFLNRLVCFYLTLLLWLFLVLLLLQLLLLVLWLLLLACAWSRAHSFADIVLPPC